MVASPFLAGTRNTQKNLHNLHKKQYKSYTFSQKSQPYDNYFDMLYDLYINDKINDNFPCLADQEYYYLDSTNQYLICPGNCKKLGKRGNWKECFSKECANEWEIMYMR